MSVTGPGEVAPNKHINLSRALGSAQSKLLQQQDCSLSSRGSLRQERAQVLFNVALI